VGLVALVRPTRSLLMVRFKKEEWLSSQCMNKGKMFMGVLKLIRKELPTMVHKK
jgi:hypothetical protein